MPRYVTTIELSRDTSKPGIYNYELRWDELMVNGEGPAEVLRIVATLLEESPAVLERLQAVLRAPAG